MGSCSLAPGRNGLGTLSLATPRATINRGPTPLPALQLLFDSDDNLNPKFKPGLLAFWGFEDSGFLPNDTMPGGTVKDLSLMWEMLNIANGSDWSPFDSLLVDDQRANARAQPDSLVNCPVFTKRSYDDEFLLALIGVLNALWVLSSWSMRHLPAD